MFVFEFRKEAYATVPVCSSLTSLVLFGHKSATPPVRANCLPLSLSAVVKDWLLSTPVSC